MARVLTRHAVASPPATGAAAPASTDPIHVWRWGTEVTTPDLATALRAGQGATVRVRTIVVNESGAEGPAYPLADAGYSGSLTTLPAAMLDGDPATGWSNASAKAATSLLPAFNGARPADWVSVTWAKRRRLSRVEVSFTIDATHSLPASVEVSAWNGAAYVPVRGATVTWATSSDTPTVITFTRVRTSRVRLDLTSARPGAADGAQRISTLTVL
jgi:beta-galactosidase